MRKFILSLSLLISVGTLSAKPLYIEDDDWYIDEADLIVTVYFDNEDIPDYINMSDKVVCSIVEMQDWERFFFEDLSVSNLRMYNTYPDEGISECIIAIPKNNEEVILLVLWRKK